MVWVRMDDGFDEHPKVLGLSDKAFRAHVSSMCYTSRNGTDGLIPRSVIERRYARELLMAGLFSTEGRDYLIHDQVPGDPLPLFRVTYAHGRAKMRASVRAVVLERDGCCLRCGSESDLQIDHVVAHSKGGGDTVGNLQVLCGPCNRWKGTQHIDFREPADG